MTNHKREVGIAGSSPPGQLLARLTTMFHKIHDHESFKARMQVAELDYLATSRAA